MSVDQPRTPGPLESMQALPDLSTDVVTRLVAGRRYSTDMSAASFRALLAAAQERGLTVIPAGCEADLSDEEEDFVIQGPFVVGRQLVWTSASVGLSEPFEAAQIQDLASEGFEELGADFEAQIVQICGPSAAIEEGIFLCNTGPLSTGTLAFGVAGSSDEAEFMGGEYIWGHDMQRLQHDAGIVGEVIAHAEQDEVVLVDFDDEADKLRRDDALPYTREPVYFLVAQYD